MDRSLISAPTEGWISLGSVRRQLNIIVVSHILVAEYRNGEKEGNKVCECLACMKITSAAEKSTRRKRASDIEGCNSELKEECTRCSEIGTALESKNKGVGG